MPAGCLDLTTKLEMITIPGLEMVDAGIAGPSSERTISVVYKENFY